MGILKSVKLTTLDGIVEVDFLKFKAFICSIFRDLLKTADIIKQDKIIKF